eukprot:CAMPEP_0183327240 /NCGR_PEP_ID=MMETSP0160_2-20130417/83664_1 /TAXON_ID=2839 ORGANISM="Odontella Sinensis, Strain Grunow 1884" /NCGR_SAMPLE_ID=MMETSP0160_2 /ASSEMBLY_ACC=CAM_ASM_000250 /LENGTH=293 /DNA_ID=CAMNT_0025495365 /DNA_START=129 /DNA_END=1010 /DNA_ORIENTATION=-
MMFSFKLFAAALALSSVDGRVNRPEDRVLATSSSKFAASFSTDKIIAANCKNADSEDSIWGQKSAYLAYCEGLKDEESQVVSEDFALAQATPLGLMKVPQGQEILATLSAEIDIVTLTTATSTTKGKKEQETSNVGSTKAMAGVSVELVAIKEDTREQKVCSPGPVTMASRFVQLSNEISAQITYEDCFGTDADDLTCETKFAEYEIQSTVGLAMGTTAAHSFQWVCTDLDQGTYNIGARFTLNATSANLCTDLVGDNCATNEDLAISRVVVGTRTMTAQQVRGAKDSILDTE